MAEKFIKENDYTLTVERTEEQQQDGYYSAIPRLVSSDVQSNAEIKLMHAKLIGMGGTPPSLEEVFPNEMHKKSTLPGGLGHG